MIAAPHVMASGTRTAAAHASTRTNRPAGRLRRESPHLAAHRVRSRPFTRTARSALQPQGPNSRDTPMAVTAVCRTVWLNIHPLTTTCSQTVPQLV